MEGALNTNTSNLHFQRESHTLCQFTVDATRLPQWPIALPGPSFLTARRVLRLFSPLIGSSQPTVVSARTAPLVLYPGERFGTSLLASPDVERPLPRSPRPEEVNVDFLLALRRSKELLTRSRTPKSRGTDLTTSLSRSFAPLPLVLLISRYRRPEARVPPKELFRPRDCSAQQVDSVVDGIHSQVPLRLSLFL